MTARDRWKQELECKKCGRSGVAELSQADGYEFMRDHETRIDEVPAGFTYERSGNMIVFSCAKCGGAA